MLQLYRWRHSDVANARGSCRHHKDFSGLRNDSAAVFAERLMKNRRSEAGVVDERLLNFARGTVLGRKGTNPIGSGRIKAKHDCTPLRKKDGVRPLGIAPRQGEEK
ncbi:hypothetical protein [Caballeronia sp. M23-90]